jgi:hypothetical protein
MKLGTPLYRRADQQAGVLVVVFEHVCYVAQHSGLCVLACVQSF